MITFGELIVDGSIAENRRPEMQELEVTLGLYLTRFNFRGKTEFTSVTWRTFLFPWFRGKKHPGLNHVILLGIFPDRSLTTYPLGWKILAENYPGDEKYKFPFADHLRWKFHALTYLSLFYPNETFFQASLQLPSCHSYKWNSMTLRSRLKHSRWPGWGK